MTMENHGYTLLRWVLGTRAAGLEVSDDEAKAAAVEIMRSVGSLAVAFASHGVAADEWVARTWPSVAARVRHDGPAVARMLDLADVPTTDSTGRTLAPAERVHYLAVALAGAEERESECEAKAQDLRRKLRAAEAANERAASEPERLSRELEEALDAADDARHDLANSAELLAATRELADAHRAHAETLATLLEECRTRRDEDREARLHADADVLAAVGATP